MKRKIFTTITVLLVSLSLLTTAYAADYGLIYDETEVLGTPAVQELGAEVLPAFSDKYGIDLRVDVLTTLADFDTIDETAAYLYEEYEYGAGAGKNGVSLTLLVEENETGASLKDWYVYANGDSAELTNGGWALPDEFYDAVDAAAWEGDAEADANALYEATAWLVVTLEDYALNGGVANTIWSPEAGLLNASNVPSVEAVESDVPYVLDYSDILTDEEESILMEEAAALAREHNFFAYIVTVDDYTAYTNGDVQSAAEAIYTQKGMGVGEEKDGLLLLLSTYDRDYCLLTHGNYGNYAFNDYAREKLQGFFLDDFGNDDMFGGFQDYLKWSGEILTAAENGNPYSEGNRMMTEEEKSEDILFGVAVIAVFPLLVAGVVIFILSKKMKSVAKAVKASSYMSGKLELTDQWDRFSYMTETRRKKEKSSSSSSGGFSGSSGKY
ncbi:MAG: TPM domain-containing protein [Bacillota bacterium]|nr:TPM domain-containing protein [Bacillota bacterium]